MNKSNKVFPIKNDAACLYKWSWSTLFLNRGTTSSCHRGKHWKVSEIDFKDFHNHPGKIGDRENMMKGIWPGNGCEYCRDIEHAGGISDRLSFVNDSVELVPPELEIDPNATHTTPTLLEVYFGNLCNQSCVYCTPGFSSQIEQEVRLYGPIEQNWAYSNWVEDDRENYEGNKAQFWEWMRNSSHNVLILQTLGGEPMYQPEFDECIEFFEQNPRPNLTWRVFTNLNHDPEKFKQKIERIQHLVINGKIKRMDFTVSIDCWGPEVEYVRYGLNLSEAEQNIETLIKDPEIGVLFHSTLTALTIPTLHKFIEKAIAWKKTRRKHWLVTINWNTVVQPDIFNPYIFGKYLAPFVDSSVEVLEQHGERFLKEIEHLRGIKQQLITTPVNKDNVNNLVKFLDEIDVRRKNRCGNWRELFPYIVDIINKINEEQ